MTTSHQRTCTDSLLQVFILTAPCIQTGASERARLTKSTPATPSVSIRDTKSTGKKKSWVKSKASQQCATAPLACPPRNYSLRWRAYGTLLSCTITSSTPRLPSEADVARQSQKKRQSGATALRREHYMRPEKWSAGDSGISGHVPHTQEPRAWCKNEAPTRS